MFVIQISGATSNYIITSMFKPPLRFRSTHIRVLPFVILISRPRNHIFEVSYNPSLQTQRDKSISAHKCHTRNYTFTFNFKKKIIYITTSKAHVTTNGANIWAGGKIQLLIQESKSHRAPWPCAYVSQSRIASIHNRLIVLLFLPAKRV